MDAIEKRARELLDAECIVDAGSDGKAGAEAKIVHRAAVRAIISALTPPDGFVLVPVEPTEAMLSGLYECHLLDASDEELRAAYADLLAARPEAP